MQKKEMLEILKEEGATVKTLMEMTDNFIVQNRSEEPKVSGYVIVKVDEGALLIPYGDVLVDEGYEQLLLDRTKIIDKETVEQIYEELNSTAEAFKNIFM